MKHIRIGRWHGLLAVFILITAFSAGNLSGNAAGSEDLQIYDSTVTFEHFDYRLNPDNSMKSFDGKSIVKTEFRVKVLENKYLKVTLLPEYGGRILSMIYKPTGHEELYQNPIGTPYGMGGGSFYYNWLMVYGGIFPTFPEPEHGKTWCLPWQTRIVTRNAEQITVEMRFTDDIARTAAVPGQFNKGTTGITCVATVSLFKDSPFVKLQLKLINNRAKPVEYEYWTCTTLAPGSEPGKTMTPENSEIMAPVKRVKVKDDWWPWMGTAEKPVDKNGHVYEFQNLALFSKWADMGIAYAYPGVDQDWWGVVNHQNGEGIFRIADNKRYTPGLKFWTWGCRQSYGTDPKTFGNSARPYIELWAGHSPEFFINARMESHEEKTWDEYYIPTVGLPKVTFANRHALVYQDCFPENGNKRIAFKAKIWTTHPQEPMTLVLRLVGAQNHDLGKTDFRGDPAKPFTVNVVKEAQAFSAGQYNFELTLKSSSGEVVAKTSTPLMIK